MSVISKSFAHKLKITWPVINATFNLMAVLVILGVFNPCATLAQRILTAGYIIIWNLGANALKSLYLGFNGDFENGIHGYLVGYMMAFSVAMEISALFAIFAPIGIIVTAAAWIAGVVLSVGFVVEVITWITIEG